MQKSFDGYIVGKHFSNLGTQKGVTPPTNPQPATIFFSIGQPNKYAKFLLGDAKKHENKNNNLICS
jgi:hypothetical protein